MPCQVAPGLGVTRRARDDCVDLGERAANRRDLINQYGRRAVGTSQRSVAIR